MRILIVCLALTACSTGIVPMDEGTYMIGKDGGVLVSQESTKAYVYSEANAFCAERSMVVETIKVETRGPIPFVRPAQAQLQFKCVPPK
jgi:hypothetical protein